MFNRSTAFLVLAFSLSAGAAAAAPPFDKPNAATGEARTPYIAVGDVTSVPYGWIDFCGRYAGECAGGGVAAVDIKLTRTAIAEIARVNGWVNDNVEPVSDMDHWGLLDQWDIPLDGKGDCEDYALYKRKLLIAEGFPRQALLMTVVKDERGEGHAILTVKTNRGEFVLDNMHKEIKPWTKTGYRFVKRQSQTDPNVWVQIGDPTDAPAYVSR